jgi:hypothetical protein
MRQKLADVGMNLRRKLLIITVKRREKKKKQLLLSKREGKRESAQLKLYSLQMDNWVPFTTASAMEVMQEHSANPVKSDFSNLVTHSVSASHVKTNPQLLSTQNEVLTQLSVLLNVQLDSILLRSILTVKTLLELLLQE